MKCTKRLLSLVLALMMTFSCMTLSAVALEEGTARNNMFCTSCNSSQVFTLVLEPPLRSIVRTVGGCSKTNFSHQHKIEYYNAHYECGGCGIKVMQHTITVSEECYYKG